VNINMGRPPRELVVRSANDAGTDAQIILNDYGDLHMRGVVYSPAEDFDAPENCPN